MANALKGEVGVKVGKKEIIFRPTFDTICDAEEKFGLPMMQLIDKHDQGNMKLKEQMALLCHFAAEEATVDSLGSEMTAAGGMNLIRTTVYRVLTVCVAGGKDAAKNTETPAEQERSTGDSSPK